MNVDKTSGSLLEFLIDKNECKWYSPKTKKTFKVEPSVLYEEEVKGSPIIEIYTNMIYFCQHDSSIPKQFHETGCPKCKEKLICYIVIDYNQINKCLKCHNVWYETEDLNKNT
jgi:hypothetical protein